MANRILKQLKFLPAASVVLSAAVFGAAQESSVIKRNTRPEAAPAATPAPLNKVEVDPARFSYEFTQPEFYVRHIVINNDVTNIEFGLRELVREARGINLDLIQRCGCGSRSSFRTGVTFYYGRFLRSTKNRRAQNNGRGGEKFKLFENSIGHPNVAMVILAKEER